MSHWDKSYSKEEEKGPVRVRIAPSPTGPLHVGHARTALFNWLYARKNKGQFLLRIEDTDRERSRPEFEREILDGLRWLGLDWDEEPVRQSTRLSLYRSVAERLVQMGRAYACFCSPEELEERRKAMMARGLPPKYDRRCRSLSDEERQRRMREQSFVLRFAMPLDGETVFQDVIRGPISFAHSELDDFVLLKSDGFPAYNFACVVDDHEMGITHVIRGEDHISNTPRQIQIYQALGWQPPRFAHLPLILGKDRSKLSSRHGATSLKAYQEMGILPEAMVNFLALLGWYPRDGREILSLDEMVEQFELSDVKPSGAIFDLEKLLWMSGHYVRTLAAEDLAIRILPYLVERGWVEPNPSSEQWNYLLQVTPLIQERMRTLSEATSLADFFYEDPEDYDEPVVSKWLTRSDAPQMLEELSNRLESLEDFTVEGIEETVRRMAAERGQRAAVLIHTTRAALTGRGEGPSLFHLMAVLGRERCVRRLRTAVRRLTEGSLKVAR
ncbi:MAG: glutamate--tRNA ligase [Armatimonadetes bacterium]|nr:glutamate--tRNA ligase [Armatimonadota bacterium]MDW8122874.1 glutamate--tRNA ligase [Armatimonadota bacterium]